MGGPGSGRKAGGGSKKLTIKVKSDLGGRKKASSYNNNPKVIAAKKAYAARIKAGK
jgi:hypothetical protein